MAMIVLWGMVAFINPGDVAKAQEQKASAHGFNKVRIEQEDRLAAPIDKADELWNFMHDRFVKDTVALRQLDPLFTSYYYEEDFTDTYFDTPGLEALAKQHGIRYRQRFNLSDPTHRKSGRELMQIKISDISASGLERGEIKFEIDHPTKFNSPDDRHPMIGLVKPSHREDFKQRLKELGLDPYAMRPILTIRDRRTRIYILRDGKAFMSVSHDKAWSNLLWAKYEMVELEPELNEIPFTEADSAGRAYMAEIGAKVSGQIKEKFPYLKQDLTPKYNRAFVSFEEQIPYLRLLIRTNTDKMDYLVGVGALSLMLLVGCVFLVKRSFSNRNGG
ncbi:MAG: CYTH domain-containing protein [bacterium]